MQATEENPSPAARLRGALMLVASAAVFPLCGMTARRLRDSIPAVEIAFLWCALSAAGMGLASALLGFRLRPKHPGLFFARGLFGATVTALFFMAVQKIPLGTATLLLFSAPIWVAIFSSLLGTETPKVLEIVFVVTAVAGVAVIADPVFGDPGLGEGLALLGGIAAGGANICAREMRRKGESVVTTYFAFLICGTAALAPVALWLWKVPAPADLPWLALFVAAGTAGNFLMTYGYRFVTATTSSILQASEIVFAVGWAYLVLGEIPPLRAAIGGVLVVGSVVGLITIRSLQR